MRIKILLILFLIPCMRVYAQGVHEFSEEKWLGVWKGTLQIVYPSSTQ